MIFDLTDNMKLQNQRKLLDYSWHDLISKNTTNLSWYFCLLILLHKFFLFVCVVQLFSRFSLFIGLLLRGSLFNNFCFSIRYLPTGQTFFKRFLYVHYLTIYDTLWSINHKDSSSLTVISRRVRCIKNYLALYWYEEVKLSGLNTNNANMRDFLLKSVNIILKKMDVFFFSSHLYVRFNKGFKEGELCF